MLVLNRLINVWKVETMKIVETLNKNYKIYKLK